MNQAAKSSQLSRRSTGIDMSFTEIQSELQAAQVSREVLRVKLENTVKDIEYYNVLKADEDRQSKIKSEDVEKNRLR
ncbi:MAG: hypothetical protein LBC17_04200 [Lactobacillaceae bacterium]|nr:hypothetical protein [Lactobacillaceae bacterium]